ncbi:MAG: hypothetical protein QOH90_2314, partial [Actinomycetota bacterium]|nr:hypothetical protein [Actinomycetota bacterium]
MPGARTSRGALKKNCCAFDSMLPQ